MTVKERWTSRKFWTAMTWEGIFTVLLVFDAIPASVFESLYFLLLGGYLTSNVAQKVLTQKVRNSR